MKLNLFTRDPDWSGWSAEQLARALDRGPVVVKQVIYSEVSLRFSGIEELDAALSPNRFVRSSLPWSAAFLAARSHRLYRDRGGTRASTLPDFFIGAHAAVLGLTLLTRDPTRFRTHVPTVHVIAPSG